MAVQVGTDVERIIPEIVPGGQSIPGQKGRGRCNRGSGSKNPNTPPPATTVTQYDSILLVPSDATTQCHSGTNVSINDLRNYNAAMPQVSFSFPGESGDDNSMYWIVPVPQNMAAVPNMRVRFHLLID